MEFDPKAVEWLAGAGFSPEFGARYLERTIDQYVNQQLGRLIVRGERGNWLCTVEEDGLAFVPSRSRVKRNKHVRNGMNVSTGNKLKPGETIWQYEVEAFLGGAFGNVYLAPPHHAAQAGCHQNSSA